MNLLGVEITRSTSGSSRLTLRRLTVGVIGVAATVTCAVGARAAWTSNGSGSATARAGTSTPLTTTAAAVTTGLLYPGVSGNVMITINNPNPYAVRITAIAGGAITVSGAAGTCVTHGVTFANQTGTWDVAASSSATFTLTNAATMSTTSQTGCQDATFTIAATLTGTSN